MNTVTLAWVEAPNKRTLFTICDAVAAIVDGRSMSLENTESRRFELNIRLSFSGADLDSISAPGSFFFVVFQKFGTFGLENRAHGELYLKIRAGIFGIQTFSHLGQITI